MSEQNDQLKVAIFEDEVRWYEALKNNVEALGCTVVAIATTITEALDEVIPQLTSLGVNLVFIDGNLTKGKGDGREGVLLAKKIKEVNPNITTVGISGRNQEYVNKYLGKKNFDLDTIKEIILGS